VKGLELSRQYFEQVGRSALERACGQLSGRLCAGLVGEGSECLGFDDAISRDHDWGPGFCVWLTGADMAAFGTAVQAAYASLPREFCGFSRLREDSMSTGRVGVLELEGFYARFLGRRTPPERNVEWLRIPEQALNVCTNGEIFVDEVGEFTAFRNALLRYYPEDVRRKRLAARCALAAQSGQYNYTRCLRRGDRVAALRALGEFVDHGQAAFFLLARRYRPYYKWAHRALGMLPGAGEEAAGLFDALCRDEAGSRVEKIEEICALILQGLKTQGLSENGSDFLLEHAREIQAGICDSDIRSLPLMAGV